jgi:fucose permease
MPLQKDPVNETSDRWVHLGLPLAFSGLLIMAASIATVQLFLPGLVVTAVGVVIHGVKARRYPSQETPSTAVTKAGSSLWG